jgi:hypothetical protein
LWGKPGAYPIVKHLKGSSIGLALALPPTNIRLGLLGLQGTNTPAYYRKFVAYGRKSLIKLASDDSPEVGQEPERLDAHRLEEDDDTKVDQEEFDLNANGSFCDAITLSVTFDLMTLSIMALSKGFI